MRTLYIRPSLTFGQHSMLSRASALRQRSCRMHCVAPLGRRAYFLVPMRPTIPNLRLYLTVSPELIRVSLPSRRARRAIRLHIAPAASAARATTSPRVPRVRCSQTARPPAPVRGTS
jgi:hypothetical protein